MACRLRGGAMIARRNEFACGTIEVAAPVRGPHHRCSWECHLSPIADDGVIGNAGRDRDFIDG